MTTMSLIRCRRSPMPFNILFLLLWLTAIPSLVHSFLPITHRPSPQPQLSLLVSQQQIHSQQSLRRQHQQQQQQQQQTCLKMSSDSASPHPLSQDKHVETILFVECGFGSDAHGQDSTKAAGTFRVKSEDRWLDSVVLAALPLLIDFTGPMHSRHD
jgi:hypothetical protein